MKFLIAVIFMFSIDAIACPSGQHEQCVIPRPWGGCAQRACVPNFVPDVPTTLEDWRDIANQFGDRIIE
jgi:hypothetical protein